MRPSKIGSMLPLVDIFSNFALGLCCIVLIQNYLINPVVKEEEAVIDVRGDYLITVSWPQEDNCDVDTWVEDPLGNLIWYSNKEEGFMHLDRDDLGRSNDKVRLPDGSIVEYPDNRELVFIRETIEGEYTVNIFMFSKRAVARDVEVKVTIHKLSGTGRGEVFNETFSLQHTGHEITATRFTVDANGDIVSFSDLPKHFVGRQ